MCLLARLCPSGSWPSHDHDPQCQWGTWLMAQELFFLQQNHRPLTIDHSIGEAVSYFYAVLLEKIGTLTPNRQAGGDPGRARWSIRVGKSCSLQRCTGVLQGMQGFAGGASNHRWTASSVWGLFGMLPGTRGVFRRKKLLAIIIVTVYY